MLHITITNCDVKFQIRYQGGTVTKSSVECRTGIVSSRNGVPKVILTVGTAFKPALGELYKKYPLAPKFAYLRSQIDFFLGRGHSASILAPTVLDFFSALKVHVCLGDLQSLHFSRFASVNTRVYKANNHC